MPGFDPNSYVLSEADAVRFPRTMRLLAYLDARNALRAAWGAIPTDAVLALSRVVDAAMFATLDDAEVWT